MNRTFDRGNNASVESLILRTNPGKKKTKTAEKLEESALQLSATRIEKVLSLLNFGTIEEMIASLTMKNMTELEKYGLICSTFVGIQGHMITTIFLVFLRFFNNINTNERALNYEAFLRLSNELAKSDEEKALYTNFLQMLRNSIAKRGFAGRDDIIEFYRILKSFYYMKNKLKTPAKVIKGQRFRADHDNYVTSIMNSNLFKRSELMRLWNSKDVDYRVIKILDYLIQIFHTNETLLRDITPELDPGQSKVFYENNITYYIGNLSSFKGEFKSMIKLRLDLMYFFRDGTKKVVDYKFIATEEIDEEMLELQAFLYASTANDLGRKNNFTAGIGQKVDEDGESFIPIKKRLSGLEPTDVIVEYWIMDYKNNGFSKITFNFAEYSEDQINDLRDRLSTVMLIADSRKEELREVFRLMKLINYTPTFGIDPAEVSFPLNALES